MTDDKVEKMKALMDEAKTLAGELSEEEMAQVSGAGVCACVVGGYGKADKKCGSNGDDSCSCMGFGTGYNLDNDKDGNRRCFCAAAGGGEAT